MVLKFFITNIFERFNVMVLKTFTFETKKIKTSQLYYHSSTSN